MTGLDGSSKINSRALLQWVFVTLWFWKKKREVQNWRKKTLEKKKTKKYLNLFENLASWRPQASSFPWLFAPSYRCSCLDHAPLRFPKALRRENPRKRHSNRATPKNSRGMFWFLLSHRNPVRKKFLYTLGSHISVCFSWFLHFSARHLFPFFAQRIQGLSTENSCQLFSARSR